METKLRTVVFSQGAALADGTTTRKRVCCFGCRRNLPWSPSVLRLFGCNPQSGLECTEDLQQEATEETELEMQNSTLPKCFSQFPQFSPVQLRAKRLVWSGFVRFFPRIFVGGGEKEAPNSKLQTPENHQIPRATAKKIPNDEVTKDPRKNHQIEDRGWRMENGREKNIQHRTLNAEYVLFSPTSGAHGVQFG